MCDFGAGARSTCRLRRVLRGMLEDGGEGPERRSILTCLTGVDRFDRGPEKSQTEISDGDLTEIDTIVDMVLNMV